MLPNPPRINTIFFYLVCNKGPGYTKQKLEKNCLKITILYSPILSLAVLHTDQQAFQCAALQSWEWCLEIRLHTCILEPYQLPILQFWANRVKVVIFIGMRGYAHSGNGKQCKYRASLYKHIMGNTSKYQNLASFLYHQALHAACPYKNYVCHNFSSKAWIRYFQF